LRGRRPRHLFVTQNGEWAAQASNSEFRFFRCDGLVCTNPEFYQRNRARWLCKLIPNGADFARFSPGLGEREEFGLPKDRRIVLMVSSLIPTKRVEVGIAAVARLSNVHLVVAGDGERRSPRPPQNSYQEGSPEYPSPLTKMPQLYCSASAFLHLSTDEPSSLG
jgi:glycosyltransferase involved in cell wall biosynthesis